MIVTRDNDQAYGTAPPTSPMFPYRRSMDSLPTLRNTGGHIHRTRPEVRNLTNSSRNSLRNPLRPSASGMISLNPRNHAVNPNPRTATSSLAIWKKERRGKPLLLMPYPQCLDDLLRTDPHATFEMCRKIADSYYYSISCFENQDWKRNKRESRDAGDGEAGSLALCIIPAVRGDPRPASPDNKNHMPGPYDTTTMVKIAPCLILSNRNRQTKTVLVITTKSHTDIEKLRDSGELEEWYVQMFRTPHEDDDQKER